MDTFCLAFRAFLKKGEQEGEFTSSLWLSDFSRQLEDLEVLDWTSGMDVNWNWVMGVPLVGAYVFSSPLSLPVPLIHLHDLL